MSLVTGKSLYRSNISLVFSKPEFRSPDNDLFNTLYGGDMATGARFIEDPVMQLKILHLPRLAMTFTLEDNRFRIDHDSDIEPVNSNLIQETRKVVNHMFQQHKLESFGFNFDIYYRFQNIIPIDFLFGNFTDKKILAKKDIRNLGIQFTLEKDSGRVLETYFLKITAPLEISVHANYHFEHYNKLPKTEKLDELFQKSFLEINEVMSGLVF